MFVTKTVLKGQVGGAIVNAVMNIRGP